MFQAGYYGGVSTNYTEFWMIIVLPYLRIVANPLSGCLNRYGIFDLLTKDSRRSI